MKIINLKAENVKKIKAVDITPVDNTVVITGKNGQGKSSVLDSILYALGGKDALKKTPKPIRDGQEKATVTLDLGEYLVIRTWNSAGTTRLEVTSKEAGRLTSPQSLLDKLVGSIAFDPLEFAGMKAEDQRAVLLDVLGLTDKVSELQVEYKEKYDERTLVGRELKNAEGHLDSIEIPDEVPEAPIDTAIVSKKLREAEAHNREVEDASEKVTSIEAQLYVAEENLKEWQENVSRLEKAQKEAKAKAVKLKKVDTTELEETLDNATEFNEAYSKKVEYKLASSEVKKHKASQKKLSDELNTILNRKEELVTTAKLPIKGLNIDADGVTYKKIPFTQLSSAEQLKVSLAIAMATNPQLRVIRIMDGSLLDTENMKVINKMAKDEDYQVWVERVEDGGKVGILIEDGEVKS